MPLSARERRGRGPVQVPHSSLSHRRPLPHDGHLDARHKAYVQVDEQGTEAAAATGFSVGDLAAGPEDTPTFLADHPFTLLIRDQLTGAILFMARIEDPRW
jgi:serine protease inhibitor